MKSGSPLNIYCAEVSGENGTTSLLFARVIGGTVQKAAWVHADAPEKLDEAFFGLPVTLAEACLKKDAPKFKTVSFGVFDPKIQTSVNEFLSN